MIINIYIWEEKQSVLVANQQQKNKNKIKWNRKEKKEEEIWQNQ